MERRVLLAVGALLLSVSGMAWADQRKYQYIPFRDNDPFVFCTQGIKDQDRAWSPMNTYSQANWRLTPGYCPIPTTGTCPANIYPYLIFMPWSQNSFDSWVIAQQVCRWPHHDGDWTARNGQGNPEDTPYSH